MKITSKHKMKDLAKMSFILSHSSQDLMEEVRVFDIPTHINKIPVRRFECVEMGELLELWDIKDNNELITKTASVFLKQEIETKKGLKIIDFDIKKIPNLPLIDFLRLTLYCEERFTYAAKLFKSLQRQSDDPKVQAILDDYKGSEYGIIARYCKIFPGKYTIQEAKKVSWVDVYLAFDEETKQNDIQLRISKIER